MNRSSSQASPQVKMLDKPSGGEFNNWDVLVGSQSLAHVLEKEGFGGLPSETFPGPGDWIFKVETQNT